MTDIIKLEKRGPGQPTKCTATVTKAMADCIRKGNYISTACALAGVSYQSYSNWMERGGFDSEADTKSPYVAFFEAVKKAESDAESEMVEAVRKAAGAGSQHWAAAMTWLERRHPDRWGKRERQEVQHSTSVRINFIPLPKAPELVVEGHAGEMTPGE